MSFEPNDYEPYDYGDWVHLDDLPDFHQMNELLKKCLSEMDAGFRPRKQVQEILEMIEDFV